MKNIWKIVGIMLFALFATTTFAQTDNGYESGDDDESADPFEESWTDKLVFGGNILPGYSNGWFIDFTPWVGYKLTETTIAGVGASYSFRQFRNPYDRYQTTLKMYGGRAFVMQDLMMGVFAQAEYDYNYWGYRLKDPFDNLIQDRRGQSPGVLIGGGYAQRGDYMSYSITALYDVFYDPNSTFRPNSFGPLVIRGGVVFGL